MESMQSDPISFVEIPEKSEASPEPEKYVPGWYNNKVLESLFFNTKASPQSYVFAYIHLILSHSLFERFSIHRPKF